MNKDGIYAAIKQCENRIGSYNADVRTKEQEISIIPCLVVRLRVFLIGFCEHTTQLEEETNA